MRIVIVGGVAGGATAAARAARVNPDAEIILLEKGPAVSFANCGLPYHIGGEIEKREKLLVATPELFRKRFGIDVRTGQEVIAIDRAEKQVEVRHADGSPNSKLAYDRLILAPGAAPIVPDWAMPAAENVSSLWTLPDMDRILSILKGQGSRRVTVVGAGYVGLEVAEQLKVAGHHVDLVERNPHVVPLLDAEMAAPINKTLQDHGIHLHLKKNVRTLQREGNRVTAVVLESGEVLPTDLVITAVGVKPRTELAVAAGLPVGKTGGIVVNEYMQTSDPDIFAVGDAVEYMHGVLHQPQRIPLAGPANRAGRVAGTVAAGGKSTPMGTVLGTAIVRVFDRTAGATGLSAKQMTRMQMPFRSVIIEAAHHASYFPGAKSMTLKVLYAPDSGKILGAQAVGMEGIDKRIDVIATVMHFGGTVEDLANVDLAYAPPFGSAKDPVHMAAFVALNDLGGMPTVLQHDAELDGFQLVDVRESAEIQRQPLPGAIHIPIDQIRQRWQELDLSKPTITVCQSGKRSHIAACFLRGKGLAAVKNLSGGMNIQGRLLKP